MSRTSLLGTALAVALLLPATLSAADDEPTLRGRTVSEWLELLRGENDASALNVVLLAVGGTAYQPITDMQYRYRRAALYAVEFIGPLKSRKVLPGVVTALRDDPDPRVREGAAQALGKMSIKVKNEKNVNFTNAREALITALRTDRSGQVRQAAATALGTVDPDGARRGVPVIDLTGATTTLAGALKDSHVGTSNAAAETLRKVGKDAYEVVPQMLAVVKDPNADVLTRIPLVQCLGRIGSPDATSAVPVFKDVLEDVKAPLDLRRAVAENTSAFGKDAAELMPVLASLMTETGAAVELRRAAAMALDEYGRNARSSLPALKKAVNDPDKFVRCLAMHAIGQMGRELGDDTKDVMTLLLKTVDDPIIEVRVAALETFGNLGRDALGTDAKVVMDRVTELSRDSRKEVREAAESTLQKLKGS